GRFVPDDEEVDPSDETTVEYGSGKVYFDPEYPDEVKIVVGEALPPLSWFTANAEALAAGPGVVDGIYRADLGDLTCANVVTFRPVPELSLGRLEDGVFTPIDQIDLGGTVSYFLVAQVLVKEEGLADPPGELQVTVWPVEEDGVTPAQPPPEHAPALREREATLLTPSPIPGYHTYRSSPDDPIIPWPFTVDGINDDPLIYFEDGGSLHLQVEE
ncbi:MAG: hypothetical protein JW990_12685, partial [Thermoleophilia bacterium]|nr:hypothetical protein [Thermoleophilia bacterium]